MLYANFSHCTMAIIMSTEQNTRFPHHTAQRWLVSALHIKCTVGLYDGNPNALYTKMNYNECTLLLVEYVREGGYI